MARLTLSVGLLSAWLILLLSGIALGGAIHLLLLASLVLFPWREAKDRKKVDESKSRKAEESEGR